MALDPPAFDSCVPDGDSVTDERMSKLPRVVDQYQDAHDRDDVDAALATFTPTATVKDDGQEYHGRDEIRDWLATASTQFTYTRTLAGADAAPSPVR